MIHQSHGERPTRCLTRASARAAGRSRVACGHLRASRSALIREVRSGRARACCRSGAWTGAAWLEREDAGSARCPTVEACLPLRATHVAEWSRRPCGVGHGPVPRRPEYMVGGRRPVRRVAPRTSTRPLSVTRHCVGRIDDKTVGRLAQCRIDAARIERRTESSNDDVVGQHTGAGLGVERQRMEAPRPCARRVTARTAA